MDREETIVKELKEYWFKDHKAVLIKHGDLEVLDWRKPGTSNYAVRYVFDGYKMYISGDIGEAVFNLTWKADIHSFDGIGIHYFIEKMAAGEKTVWDDEAAVERLEEWKKERLDDSEYYFENDKEKEEFEEFIEELEGAARESRTTEQWAWQYVNGEYESDISKYDCDYWEWLYDIGNVVPYHTYGFLIGLQMASEQLKEDEKISEMKNYSKACNQMENCEVCVKTMKDADTPCTCMRKKYGESIWDYK